MGGIKTEFCPFYWSGNRPLWKPKYHASSGSVVSSNDVGQLRQDLEEELWIWRPVLAQLVTLEAIKSGEVTSEDLLKLNALLDMREAIQSKSQMENSA